MLPSASIFYKIPKLTCTDLVRNYRKFNRRKLMDPGIAHRKSLAESSEDIRELEDHDFDLEADFMNVADSHREHEREQLFFKDRLKHLIVKQKHFKEKYPNFLSWSDKEQIRYLHKTDPEEWTVDKLSDGFPALPEVIQKIIKSSWTKKLDNKVHNHDESVKQNWKLFKEGKLPELPQELAHHLKKFQNRATNLKPFQMPNKVVTNPTKSMLVSNIKIGNEFSKIITDYEKLKNKNVADDTSLSDKNFVGKPPREDTFMPRTNIHQHHLTLQKLQERIETKAKTKEISEDEQLMLQAYKDKEKLAVQTSTATSDPTEVTLENSNKDTKMCVIVKNGRDYSALMYPERISIPRKLYKAGYTYKLNDCYYDDDGEFLYRVPGMDQ